MAETLWDQFEYLIKVLKENGFDGEATKLTETLEFSTSSNELYFKASGILKFFLSQNACNDKIALKKLNKLNMELDAMLS